MDKAVVDFVKNLGVWGKREQDDLHKSTCHPRGTGKTRVLGKRWENMSEKLECSSHLVEFLGNSMVHE